MIRNQENETFMIKLKICMLGAFAVGKTSLVKRYVNGIFSENYLTSIGVKIDKKTVLIENKTIELMLWDIHGEDKFQKVQASYLRGASGYFLIVDGTRQDTLETARILQNRAENAIGKVPYIVVVNKADLKSEWEFDIGSVDRYLNDNLSIIETSAKTGQGVEDIFSTLTRKIVEE